MKIYTKKGDKGETSLLGGTRVSKASERVEVYGTIDELNAFVGHLHDLLAVQSDTLLAIQRCLFNLGSLLSFDGRKEKIQLPEITPADIQLLESEIDKMQALLHPLKEFILPCGHPHTSFCHIVRCVCRKAERKVVALAEKEDVPNNSLEYLNRLSDYFFVLSRFVLKENNGVEFTWK